MEINQWLRWPTEISQEWIEVIGMMSPCIWRKKSSSGNTTLIYLSRCTCPMYGMTLYLYWSSCSVKILGNSAGPTVMSKISPQLCAITSSSMTDILLQLINRSVCRFESLFQLIQSYNLKKMDWRFIGYFYRNL